MLLQTEIVRWYNINKRDLPWRNTLNPYEIWISEVILQQTRVNQALSFYYLFLDRFPSVYSLAEASEHDVLKTWQGLGYYSRARNLHFSAKYIVKELNGEFPANFKDLKCLKGIGEYTAAAIASFAYNEKVPVLDGNVFRVLARIYAEETAINSTKGKKLFFGLASQLIDSQEPFLYNQAIMEFGALQCVPQNPNCQVCCIKEYCQAYQQNKVPSYPVKTKSIKKRNRFFHYFFINNNGSTYIKKRSKKDIWQGLYEFPLIETNEEIDITHLSRTKEWLYFFENTPIVINSIEEKISHQLTHQQLFIQFILLSIELEPNCSFKSLEYFEKIQIDDIVSYPVPKPIESFIERNSFTISDFHHTS